jgi:hypothetical protein
MHSIYLMKLCDLPKPNHNVKGECDVQAYFVADLYDMGPLCGPVKQYTATLLSGDEDADHGNGHMASWNVTDANRHNRASSQNTE